MAGNSFGKLFTYTTWGESHGAAIGAVVDGVPPRIPLTEADIQPYLDKRKPGQSRFTTQRQESDTIKILSGTFEGLTTGTPISLMIENEDMRSKDYGDIKDKFRPGHADYTYFKKYGIRDYRGGGRSSARETAMRVAAGAVARKVLDVVTSGQWPVASEGSGVRGQGSENTANWELGTGNSIIIRGAVIQIGKEKISRENWDWSETEKNPFWCPDKKAASKWEDYLDGIRKSGSSAGAIIEVHASGVPAGLGEPVYDKLDADIAKAMMSINAVKAVEIGAGFEVASLRGEENADEIRISPSSAEGRDGDWSSSDRLAGGLGAVPPKRDKALKGEPVFLSNNAGGILGGISSGQDIVVRFAVKPTSSILTPVNTIDVKGNETDIITKGRHDPCVGIRAVPIGEAMLAIVLADHLLRHKAQCL